ncbi:RIBOSOMAL RNA-PROCESSING 1 [Salix purpurea]|uniref:RIBOSOMAL RNA-PROCESSING 1 n=1 Tax=Salix purpurea TaxID=77065 RepID=A0A9Q0VHV2_SALPP|nr:RIBOSOMAL RNA-PROCESSING 1 [Salix purpurea]
MEEVHIQAQTSKTLIQQLASSDSKTRNKSLKILLNKWLPSQPQISEETMKKLWKGLFYCMWHADKSLAQNQLINKLSSLLTVIEVESVCFSYFSVFLVTMRREWSGIDGLRLDKFYLLIRRFMNSFFGFLKKKGWGLDVVERFMRGFVEKGFLADDNFLGNGVNYHVVSVFVEELKGFLPVKEAVLEVFFGNFLSVMGKVSDKVLLGKIKSNVFDLLLRMGKELLEVKMKGDDVGDNDEVVVLGSIALVMGFSKRFYELGSSVECCQGNRKVILGLHEVFLKLEKDFVTSGIKIALPESNGDEDGEEVPVLVPIDSGMGAEGLNGGIANGPGSKKLKKSKKAKESDGNSKRAKKKKRNVISGSHSESTITDENGYEDLPNGENSSKEKTVDDSLVRFDESAIANLQRQFEKVAAEVGIDEGVTSACDFPKVTGNGNLSKKRKRVKRVEWKQSENPNGQEDAEAGTSSMAKSSEKSAKKVRFSMTNNLVWKPSTPLPPQSLRIPPSVTPRGSALKKGIPPGPVREMPAKKRMQQRAKSMKKVIKGISPATKRVKKLKSLSI